MPDDPNEHDRYTKRLRILQINLNKSQIAQEDLLNSVIHTNYDVILIQEPWLDFLGNTRGSYRWCIIYPTPHHTDGNSKHTRSVILVNSSLNTNNWKQIPFPSSDVTVIQLTDTQTGNISIFNLYIDCTNTIALTALDHFYTQQAHIIKP